MLTFLRVHVVCASLIGVLAPRLHCLAISLKPPVISLLIIVQSNLFLSPNANHPIGLPHYVLSILVSLSATVVPVLFCFFFCIFLLLFHAVHRPSFHATCINSISPCRVDQSVSSQQVCFVDAAHHTYHLLAVSQIL
ncbi:uncharacterized protein F5147DRAFT_720964 [Suillus discolor]|uniref:Secreted peptide n=1 Tax=Suillus discolor TaxID=1912936 RepID=A0A9P7JNA7_9AGAM|nr:uncharacterized protein F5147DRAFT_720964 [Suillus discolor]KAG2093297.1 hypothetical protein F5147DRAFT_720964 [Suillus discolor]